MTRSFALRSLASHELAELGMRIRRSTETAGRTCAAIGTAIADHIADAFGPHDGLPQLALVRVYVTRRHETFDLIASRGLEPAWNDVATSRDHRSIPLADVSKLPMVARLFESLRVPELSRLEATSELARRVFFVEDAVGSPHITAQQDFAVRYNVRSVIGFGDVLPNGDLFVVLMFTRVVIASEIALAFEALALHARIALSTATDLEATRLVREESRTRAYEQLLRLQEYQFIRQGLRISQTQNALTARTSNLERELAERARENAARLERVQRAMLNVIADLREARTMLEQRVADRTRELALANARLEASNTELEQFNYIASHDLQEPLRTIAGYLQLIEERYADRLDHTAREFIGFAVGGAQRMRELIEALLSYSRVSRGALDREEVSLDVALDEALQSLGRALAESGARVEREPLPYVHGDRVLLRQLFQNLIGNSIKFRTEAAPIIEVRADGHEIRVRDNGIGFDAKFSEQIFKVFRRLQRKHPGTGIGLAICKKIAEQHGATIRALSAPGEGSTFVISFPKGKS